MEEYTDYDSTFESSVEFSEWYNDEFMTNSLFDINDEELY